MSGIAQSCLRRSQTMTTLFTIILNSLFFLLGNRALTPTALLPDAATDTVISSLAMGIFICLFTRREVRLAARRMREANEAARPLPPLLAKLPHGWLLGPVLGLMAALVFVPLLVLPLLAAGVVALSFGAMLALKAAHTVLFCLPCIALCYGRMLPVYEAMTREEAGGA